MQDYKPMRAGKEYDLRPRLDYLPEWAKILKDYFAAGQLDASHNACSDDRQLTD
jgi:hypothetical protein